MILWMGQALAAPHTLSPNTPYAVSPDGGYTASMSIPSGYYYLCAMIDSGSSISETSEVDNLIRSDKTFTILPWASPLCL